MSGQREPSPFLLFETITAYQRTAAIRTGIELGVFTAIGGEPATAGEIAARCEASERGIRILCDNLTSSGFLEKQGERYALTPDSAVFLDRRSPAYAGGVVEFLLSPTITGSFEHLTEAVRRGGTAIPDAGTIAPEHPVWVRFARSMMPMMDLPARMIPSVVPCDPDRPLKVLDVAAGHGLFGISFAQRYPRAEIVAQDWPQVLEVARENARAAGVEEQLRLLPGDAFEVDFGEGYDLVLLTNFLHHFDVPTCERLLRKVHAALRDGGRAVTLEFVPNEDRVTPPETATFSLVMLASTPSGDAYTFSELDRMFRNAGFSRSELHPLPPSPEQVVVSFR